MSDQSTPPSASVVNEKAPDIEHTERIVTHDRVPGHENYYEKNGLRTYGDGEDHDHEPPVSSLNAAQEFSLTHIVAFLSSVNVVNSNGVPLDWIADSCLHLWLVDLHGCSEQRLSS
jgi:hypothetical protein